MSNIVHNNADQLFEQVSHLIAEARSYVAKTVNSAMVVTYYEIGRHGNPFRIPDNFNVEPAKRTFNNYGKGSNFHNSPKVKIGTGTTVGAEAAYFINPYIGVGARARVTTAPAYAEGLSAYDENMNVIPGSNSASDVWATADWAAGIHFSLPITYRQNIGAKVLLGHRYYGTLDFSGVYDTTYKDAAGEEQTRTIYGDNLYIEKTDADIVSGGLQYNGQRRGFLGILRLRLLARGLRRGVCPFQLRHQEDGCYPC